MSKNSKRTSNRVGSIAGRTLRDANASSIQKSLAASALSQIATDRQTGSEMEAKASRALDNPRAADLTKTLAATVVAQSNKKR